MARAVSPWLHRVCTRLYGPKDPWERLLLFAHNSFMGEDGSHYYAQQSIAEAACMGVSTVRAKTVRVSKAGWLALIPRGREGQQWKSYTYRACVPDWIDLNSIGSGRTLGEALATAHESKYGLILAESVSGSLYPQLGKPRRPPPPAGGIRARQTPVATSSTASSVAEHRQPTGEAPPAEPIEHRQPVGTKSSSDVLNKVINEGALASSRTARQVVIDKQLEVRKPNKREISDDDLAKKSLALMAGRKCMSPNEISTFFDKNWDSVTPERVERCLRQKEGKSVQ